MCFLTERGCGLPGYKGLGCDEILTERFLQDVDGTKEICTAEYPHLEDAAWRHHDSL